MRLFSQWKRFLLAISLVLVFAAPMSVAFLTPSAEAGIVPCGASQDDPSTVDSNEAAPCTLCHLVIGVKRLIDWGLQIMTFFAVAVIVAMGILYILSAGDQKMISTAKEGLKASLYGFSLMLLMWLFVAVVLATFAKNVSNFKSGATWYNFTCSTRSNVGTSTMPIGTTANTQLSGQVGATTCTTGRCAKNTEIQNALQKNAAGVEANKVLSIIEGGEGCNKSVSSDGFGSCGYSQALPSVRRTVCGLTGSDAQTCALLQNNVQADIDCAAKLIKDNGARCGMDIQNIASCYNSGKPNNCARTTNNYCGRVNSYYGSC